MIAPFNHRTVDAMLAPAVQIVGAVRDDKPAEFLEALHTAQTTGGVEWRTALIVALAGMVPDNRTVGELTSWLVAS